MAGNVLGLVAGVGVIVFVVGKQGAELVAQPWMQSGTYHDGRNILWPLVATFPFVAVAVLIVMVRARLAFGGQARLGQW